MHGGWTQPCFSKSPIKPGPISGWAPGVPVHLLLNLEDAVQVVRPPMGRPRQCLSPEESGPPHHSVQRWVPHGHISNFSLYSMLQNQRGQGRGRAEEPPEGTRTHKLNEQLHNTEPKTKIHDWYHEMYPWYTPRPHF